MKSVISFEDAVRQQMAAPSLIVVADACAGLHMLPDSGVEPDRLLVG